jgi:hypothetical protein
MHHDTSHAALNPDGGEIVSGRREASARGQAGRSIRRCCALTRPPTSHRCPTSARSPQRPPAEACRCCRSLRTARQARSAATAQRDETERRGTGGHSRRGPPSTVKRSSTGRSCSAIHARRFLRRISLRKLGGRATPGWQSVPPEQRDDRLPDRRAAARAPPAPSACACAARKPRPDGRSARRDGRCRGRRPRQRPTKGCPSAARAAVRSDPRPCRGGARGQRRQFRALADRGGRAPGRSPVIATGSTTGSAPPPASQPALRGAAQPGSGALQGRNAVHLELGTWRAWPTERAEHIGHREAWRGGLWTASRPTS